VSAVRSSISLRGRGVGTIVYVVQGEGEGVWGGGHGRGGKLAWFTIAMELGYQSSESGRGKRQHFLNLDSVIQEKSN
jgi:hypothetical protein